MTPNYSNASPLFVSKIAQWNDLPVNPTQVGSIRPIMDEPSRSFSRLEAHATYLNAGCASHEPHRHNDEEIIIVKKGVIEVMINDQTHQVKAGGVVVIASNDFHGICNPSEDAAEYYVIRAEV